MIKLRINFGHNRGLALFQAVAILATLLGVSIYSFRVIQIQKEMAKKEILGEDSYSLSNWVFDLFQNPAACSATFGLPRDLSELQQSGGIARDEILDPGLESSDTQNSIRLGNGQKFFKYTSFVGITLQDTQGVTQGFQPGVNDGEHNVQMALDYIDQNENSKRKILPLRIELTTQGQSIEVTNCYTVAPNLIGGDLNEFCDAFNADIVDVNGEEKCFDPKFMSGGFRIVNDGTSQGPTNLSFDDSYDTFMKYYPYNNSFRAISYIDRAAAENGNYDHMYRFGGVAKYVVPGDCPFGPQSCSVQTLQRGSFSLGLVGQAATQDAIMINGDTYQETPHGGQRPGDVSGRALAIGNSTTGAHSVNIGGTKLYPRYIYAGSPVSISQAPGSVMIGSFQSYSSVRDYFMDHPSYTNSWQTDHIHNIRHNVILGGRSLGNISSLFLTMVGRNLGWSFATSTNEDNAAIPCNTGTTNHSGSITAQCSGSPETFQWTMDADGSSGHEFKPGEFPAVRGVAHSALFTLGCGTGEVTSGPIPIDPTVKACFIVTQKGDIYAKEGYVHFSDSLLKEKQENLDNKIIQKIEDLPLVRYRWKESYRPGLGVLAQDLQQVFPKLVSKTAQDFLTIKTIPLLPVLQTGLREQRKEIKNLQKKLRLLKGKKVEE